MHPAQSENVVSEVAPRCRRLNAHILERALHSDEITVLALARHRQRHHRQSRTAAVSTCPRARAPTQEQWARYARERFATLGIRLVKDRKTLETAEENLVYLRREAKSFAEQGLAVLEALGIA